MELQNIKNLLENSLQNVKLSLTQHLDIINEKNNNKITIELDNNFENRELIVHIFENFHTHLSKEIKIDTLLEKLNEIINEQFVVVSEFVNNNSTLKYKASCVVNVFETQEKNIQKIVENCFGKKEIKNLYLNGGEIVIKSWSGKLDKKFAINKGEFCW